MPDIKIDYDEVIVRDKILAELNKYNKIEQKDIKELTGLNKDYIANIFQDGPSRQRLSLPVLILFAKVLRKPIEFFLYNSDEFKNFLEGRYVKIQLIDNFTDNNNNLIYKKNNCCAVNFEYLNEIVLDPFRIVMLKIKSDIMEKTIHKNDFILIDLLEKEIHDGLIYAYNSFDFKDIQIRRFFIEIDKIKLMPDNKINYEAFFAERKDINIIGQVIFAKHFL